MSQYEDIIFDNDTKIKCNLCSIYLKGEDYIEAHVSGKSHREMEVKKSLLQNSIVTIDDNFYCYICDALMDLSSLRDHLQGAHHDDNIKQLKEMVKKDGIFLKLPEELSNKEVAIHCVLCDCPISYTQESVQHHILSKRHRQVRAIVVQPLNGIFSVEDSNDHLWCKFCQCYFENYIEVIFEHVDDNDEHKKKVAKILNLIKGQHITIEKFLMDPTEDKACCTKCDKEVPCNLDNLTSHVKGKQHNK